MTIGIARTYNVGNRPGTLENKYYTGTDRRLACTGRLSAVFRQPVIHTFVDTKW